jgi:hypothetical protein
MITHETCGYQGHCCSSKDVQFISRYRDQNDYCVGGNRVSVYDSGEVRNGSAADYKRILLFELARYAEYIARHVRHKEAYGMTALQPFGFAELAAAILGGGR